MAQAYNHMIMPLANRRDKVTQVKRALLIFSADSSALRRACGCPKMAVDIETLDIMAEQGLEIYDSRATPGVESLPIR